MRQACARWPVAQRAWVEVLLKALLAQGARKVALLASQLCLPLQPGSVTAALQVAGDSLELTLRQAPQEGLGLVLPLQAQQALQTTRAFAGDVPLTVYVAQAELAQYQQLAAAMDGVTVEPDHWAHWISGAKNAPLDLAGALGTATGSAADWRRWRWPIRLRRRRRGDRSKWEARKPGDQGHQHPPPRRRNQRSGPLQALLAWPRSGADAAQYRRGPPAGRPGQHG